MHRGDEPSGVLLEDPGVDDVPDAEDPTEQSASGEQPRGARINKALVFPAAVLALFLVLVALGWNGSSSAMISRETEGPFSDASASDPHNITGEPNAIRSDEWWVVTPMVIGQDAADYPRVNDNFLGGTDVSVFSSIPYREWSVAFRPQFWGFLVLPFEQAFAFSWWFPAVLLALASYALVLTFCPKRPGMAAAAGVAMCFAPFVQWWYLIITLCSLGWAMLLVASVVLVGRASTRRQLALSLAGVAFTTTAFLMVLYPAFQISCAWAAAACIVGWTFRAGATDSVQQRLRRLGLAAAGAAGGAAIFGVFAATRWELFERQANSEYPGNRSIPSGGANLASIFSGFLDRNLFPSNPGSVVFGVNASEASAFVLVGVFLALPASWLVWRGWRRGLGIDGLLVALLATLGLFFAFLLVEGIDFLGKLTLLSQVPHVRLYIGLGFLSLALLAAVVRELDRQGLRAPWPLVAVTALVALAIHLRTGFLAEDSMPTLAGGRATWLVMAAAVTAMVALAARGHGGLALAGLALFSVWSTYDVHPLNDGVYDGRSTAVGRAVRAVDEADPGAWVAVGGPPTQALLTEQPVLRMNGTALYADFDDWTELDPTGAQRAVYNRYAIISYLTDPALPDLHSPTPDTIIVRLDGCGRFAQRRLEHVLSEQAIDDDCLRLERTVEMPAQTYYIYDVVPP